MKALYWFVILLIFLALMMDTGLAEKFTNFAYGVCKNGLSVSKWEDIRRLNPEIPYEQSAGAPCRGSCPAGVLEVCKRNCGDDVVEGFFGSEKIWVYVPTEISSRFWADFGSRRTVQMPSAFEQLCIDSVRSANKNMEVVVIADCDLDRYLKPDEMAVVVARSNDCIDRYNFIKWTILSRHGGLWMPPHVICLRSLDFPSRFFNDNSVIAFGQRRDSMGRGLAIDDCIVGGGRNRIFAELAGLARRNLQWPTRTTAFEETYLRAFNDMVARPSCDLHFFNRNENGRLDRAGIPVTVDAMVSQNPTVLLNPEEVRMVALPYADAKKLFKYQYLTRLSKEQILGGDMWISRLFNGQI
jgi:hypothetical protein